MIRIDFEGIDAFSELGRMVDSFDADLSDEETVIHAQVRRSDQSVTGVICLVEGSTRYDCEVKILRDSTQDAEMGKSNKTLGRRALLLALYRLLARRTGRTLPYGILFGVRPGKLVHQRLKQNKSALAPDIAGELVANYAMRQDRADLLVEVAQHERSIVPDLYDLSSEVSLYVGIPFCPTHCSYCTFPAYSMRDKARYAVDFMQALIHEIRAVGESLQTAHIGVTTVYVGGGTPTSLSALELERLLAALRDELPGHGAWREFSVEAGRADTITPDRVKVMKAVGVNRVSVNPQTFRDATLKKVGRGHSASIIDKRFALFREAGFQNINMDLIMGLPGESLDDARNSLARTLALSPDSVTVHTLSYKRGAEVKKSLEVSDEPDASTVEAMLDLAERELRGDGYHPYYLYRQKDILAGRENIGYARLGKEGLYNMAIIEEVQTIVALGGGGASKWVDPQTGQIMRSANAREPSAYVAHLDHIIADKRERIAALAKKIRLK